jgi:hypothetical protein
MAWWTTAPAPDLEHEQAISMMQHWMTPVTFTVAVLALMLAAGRIILTRKGDPLIEVVTGLTVVAAVTGGTTALAIVLPNRLLQFGDEFSGWILAKTAGGGFGAKLTEHLALNAMTALLAVLLGCLALVLGLIQALLLLFRQAALIVLAGMLPLAAAGTLTRATRPWIRKVSGWMLALAFYKPLAALVYATIFTLAGNGNDLHTCLMTLAMMVIALVAFPVLLKFFSWTTGDTGQASSGSILGTVVGGITAVGAMRGFGGGFAGHSSSSEGDTSGRDSAANQSAYLDQQLGNPGQGSNRRPGTTGPLDAGSPNPHRDGRSGFSDPSRPTGSGTTGNDATGGQPGHQGQEPVGPGAFEVTETEARRTQAPLRWMNNPTGSSEAGGPDGAGPAGGGSGG